MFGKTAKSRLIYLATLVVGGISACGQSLLIHKELHNYPYKIMSFPPPEFT
jgi:hypothetical protein